MNKLAKTIVIPSGCVERFVDFSDLRGGKSWFGEGVFMAAKARHVPDYRIDYPRPKRHSVMYCLKGSYPFEYGVERGVLTPGSFLVLPAGTRQTFRTDEVSGAVFFLLDPAVFGSAVFRLKKTENASLLSMLMEKALSEQASGSPGSARIRENIANLVISLVRGELFEEHPETAAHRLETELRKHPERPWTVEQMAAFCGLSASHLFAVCRQAAGCSPCGLLTGIRMELAETLLCRTDYPVKAIAFQCGYELPFSFTRVFARRHGGVPPERWRRKEP